MKNKKGFTLTEVLLAVMIVGLIGISLAALTRSAARESGVGRSKVMLRNNLSLFMRTLRADLMSASRVDSCVLCGTNGAEENAFSVSPKETIEWLRLTKNQTLNGEPIIDQLYTRGDSTAQTVAKTVLYCFVNGEDTTNITPSNAVRGGKIYRYETTVSVTGTQPTCGEAVSVGEMVLNNVKYIPSSYAVPMIGRHYFSRESQDSMLKVNIITEIDSTPVVNETVEETFAVPIGF